MGSILVTGGAGYIGSHTVKALVERGLDVVVIDDLSRGHRVAARVPDERFYHARIGDERVLEEVFSAHEIDAVVHFAAYAYVGESVEKPLMYYRNNVAEVIPLVDCMRRYGCAHMVFSSTCATYGDPQHLPLDESHPQRPVSPYGRSKLMVEMILKDCETSFGLRSVALRYFNAFGCAANGEIGEDHRPETHLIPLALEAARDPAKALTVFGTDYDTPDGTCVRDYVHVDDLADAHVRALRYLESGGTSTACNLGMGEGISVKEVIEVCEKVVGRRIAVVTGSRREGDAVSLYASVAKASEVLGWEPKHRRLDEGIEAAWRWLTGPNGGRYASRETGEERPADDMNASSGATALINDDN